MNIGDRITYRGRVWTVTRTEPSGLVVIESELGERMTTTASRLDVTP